MGKVIKLGLDILKNESKWKAIQSKLGLKSDGWPGLKTISNLESLLGIKENSQSKMNPPQPTTSAKIKFFGKAGKPEMTTFKPPYEMEFSWGGKVPKIGCHKLIAEPLKNALTEISSLGTEYIKKHGLHLYAGCFNYRKTRGGNTLSDHAFACAIDLNPDANGNKTTWNPGSKGSNGTYQMPRKVVKIFQKHGFQVGFKRSDGSRRDMMHIAFIKRS